jgi:hypothetical protein
MQTILQTVQQNTTLQKVWTYKSYNNYVPIITANDYVWPTCNILNGTALRCLSAKYNIFNDPHHKNIQSHILMTTAGDAQCSGAIDAPAAGEGATTDDDGYCVVVEELMVTSSSPIHVKTQLVQTIFHILQHLTMMWMTR